LTDVNHLPVVPFKISTVLTVFCRSVIPPAKRTNPAVAVAERPVRALERVVDVLTCWPLTRPSPMSKNNNSQNMKEKKAVAVVLLLTCECPKTQENLLFFSLICVVSGQLRSPLNLSQSSVF